MRWNISRIVLYSHDDQSRVLLFRPGEVNIITGESGTGKSAIIQVIDFCIGSKKCEIADFVKSRCSWVAMVWVRDAEECFIARKVPASSQPTTRRFHLITGSNLHVPAKRELPDNGGETGALSRFTRLLGISEASSETFGAETRDTFSVSARHTLPFVFQSDEVIMNRRTLFWGGNDIHRQSIIDTLPYFFGAVDEKNTALQQRLAELRRERKRLERKAKASDTTGRNRSALASELVAEATQLGMISDPEDQVLDESSAVLTILASWEPRQGQAVEGASPLVQLQEREKELTANFFSIDREVKEAERLVSDVTFFGATVASQAGRLEAVNLIKPHEPLAKCPLCDGHLEEMTEPLENLKFGLNSLQIDLAEVAREKPRVQEVIISLKARRYETQAELRNVRSQIMAIVREDEELARQHSLDALRNQLIGKAKQLLRVLDEKISPEETTNFAEIAAEIESLESSLDPEVLRERLEALANRVNQMAKPLLERLPFDDNYRSATAAFNPRMLATSLLTSEGRLINMEGIGSDENYLSLHVAFMLSIHKLFRESERPIPSVLVLDQVSRPYFPPDANAETIDLDKETRRVDERQKVKAIFDVLFSAVEQEKTLQVIVLEHALFPSDKRFMNSIVEEWPKGTGLVPAGWLSVN